MMTWRSTYRAVWVMDFEFIATDGACPLPVCMVARDLISGEEFRLWQHELGGCPIVFGPDALLVAYFAPAELACFASLSWAKPARVLDLYAEYRALQNGNSNAHGSNLLAAAEAFGLQTMADTEKSGMRELIMSGGPWSPAEQAGILEYCAADVDITAKLFEQMWPLVAKTPVDLGHALFRGRYMTAVAQIEATGTPIDTETLDRLTRSWPQLQSELIAKVDQQYGIYDGSRFVSKKFEAFVLAWGYAWPRSETGRLQLDDDTFRAMAKRHPELGPLHELRIILGQMRLIGLTVGPDGRNRTMLSPFRSKTGRNQPSNSKFIFGPSTWLRGLIKPEPGHGLAYCDFSSQEIAIAAALSGDHRLWEAYSSGDPYMAFAVQAGLAPAGSTKASHKVIRNRCKAIVLGVGYGMGAAAMALAAGIHPVEAESLLQSHKRTYRIFWAWAESAQHGAMLGQRLLTPLGWPLRLRGPADINERSLLNWPMQASGSDMMRLACCLLTEAGIEVCCPVHDALLVRFQLAEEERVVALTKQLMGDASECVMGAGYRCRVDADVVCHPDRYMDERGEAMWGMIMSLLDEIETREGRSVPAYL